MEYRCAGANLENDTTYTQHTKIKIEAERPTYIYISSSNTQSNDTATAALLSDINTPIESQMIPLPPSTVTSTTLATPTRTTTTTRTDIGMQWSTTEPNTSSNTNINAITKIKSETNKRSRDMRTEENDHVVIPINSTARCIAKQTSFSTPTNNKNAKVDGTNRNKSRAPLVVVTGASLKSKPKPQKPREFAPSIPKYLQQEPSRFGPRSITGGRTGNIGDAVFATVARVVNTNNNVDGVLVTTKDHPPLTPVGKYLPRPEWFNTINCIMKTEIKAIKNDYNFDFYDLFGSYYGTEYDRHLEYCIRRSEDAVGAYYLSDDDDKNEDLRRKQKKDFIKEQLKAHIIYFDHDEMIWKSQKTIPKKNSTRTRRSSIPLTKPSPLDKYNSTYESIIQQRHCHEKSRPLSTDTILHTAIKANTTHMALEIIRIEYQTFLDCVRRNIATNQHLHLTLLGGFDDNAMTPLDLAALKGNIQIVQELLLCGVPLFDSKRTRSIGSIVFLTAKYGQIKVIEFIIDYYQSNKGKQSHDKQSSYTKPWPKRLKDVLDKPKMNGTTPLMCAAQNGHIAVVKLLLRHKVVVNRKNTYGMTALHFAAQSGHVQICQLLHEHSAANTILTSKFSSALMLACKRGHVDVVKTLLVGGCYLFHKDMSGRTAQNVIQNRIEFRRENREEQNSPFRSDSEAELDEANINEIPHHTDNMILSMLNQQSQREMMRRAIRVKRNFEMTRIYTLFQQNRARIKFRDGNVYDVHNAIHRLTDTMTHSSVFDSNLAMITPLKDTQLQQQVESKLPKPPSSFLNPSTQILLRTMLLPKPLFQSIALFLPLPTLWSHRIIILDNISRRSNPNEAIIDALDIIDEILEAVGFLSACDAAQIPAPMPHWTWCEWKRSIHQGSTFRNEFYKPKKRSRTNPVEPQEINVTTSTPLWPQDENCPTILELRRRVGYLPLLSQNQLHSNIVMILLSKPYGFPLKLIKELIKVADIASICRRCCITATLPPSSLSSSIAFDSNAASDMVDLIFDLYSWYENRDNGVFTDNGCEDESNSDSDDSNSNESSVDDNADFADDFDESESSEDERYYIDSWV